MSNINMVFPSDNDSAVLKFVQLIAGSYPQYVFTFSTPTCVRVTCDEEKLGDIQAVWNNADQIRLRSYTSAGTGSRGLRTKDFKKAVKIFANNFKPKEVASLMAELSVLTRTYMNNLCLTRKNTTTVTFNKMLETNLNALATALVELIDMSELQTTVETTAKLSASGFITLRRGSRYVVQRVGGSDIYEYGNATLPYNIRANLAMLKLVEDGTILADKGLRISAEKFVVLEDNDE